jgi:hypothetical protein
VKPNSLFLVLSVVGDEPWLTWAENTKDTSGSTLISGLGTSKAKIISGSHEDIIFSSIIKPSALALFYKVKLSTVYPLFLHLPSIELPEKKKLYPKEV